ncbi:hypothetical protein K466DRAFT_667361 [Polyporus arcularius HHB13444]|uniref:Uncharacterized protein n=1 Tax=Polyporus arcularius HHB13444 TaxID=1314778 RepID=A0A5C3P5I0_9APHY|nr:hypothetical protein K466DRAFT_667361 [Polyporus arcularius HHB13444]
MPQCQALPSTGRCQNSAQEPGLYCAEHTAEATKHVDAYNTAKREADALEILVADFAKADISEQLRDFGEAGTAAAVLKAFADRLDRAIKVAEEYQVHFGAQVADGLASKESLADLGKKRDAAFEVLAKAELWRSNTRELDPKPTVASIPRQAQAAENRCQAYLETEGCTPCPDPVAEGLRFCLAHHTKHSSSLSELEKARIQSRESLDDYENVFGSGSRAETIKFLQKYVVSVRMVMEHLEEHQQQFQCKTEEQHAVAISELEQKRKKAMLKVDDLVLWDNVVSLAKKAAPFGSMAFFVMLICIVLSQ